MNKAMESMKFFLSAVAFIAHERCEHTRYDTAASTSVSPILELYTRSILGFEYVSWYAEYLMWDENMERSLELSIWIAVRAQWTPLSIRVVGTD